MIITAYIKWEICRPRCKTDIKNEEQRIVLKQKLSDGELNTWEILQTMGHPVGNIKTQDIPTFSESEFHEDEGDQNTKAESVCIV